MRMKKIAATALLLSANTLANAKEVNFECYLVPDESRKIYISLDSEKENIGIERGIEDSIGFESCKTERFTNYYIAACDAGTFLRLARYYAFREGKGIRLIEGRSGKNDEYICHESLGDKPI
jgi:hypothetical protein